MTHTPGFEERPRNSFVARRRLADAAARVPDAHLPRQIFAPGTVPAYSNYATTLAGYIVERARAEPFEDYVDEHIFEPLGMRTPRSSSRCPSGCGR